MFTWSSVDSSVLACCGCPFDERSMEAGGGVAAAAAVRSSRGRHPVGTNWNDKLSKTPIAP